jgi:antitoxin MazE
MVTKVQKWGNSLGVRLARQVVEDARLVAGDTVDVAFRDGVIVVAPARRPRRRVSLRNLVRRIPAGYRPEEVRWGKAVGKEAL